MQARPHAALYVTAMELACRVSRVSCALLRSTLLVFPCIALSDPFHAISAIAYRAYTDSVHDNAWYGSQFSSCLARYCLAAAPTDLCSSVLAAVLWMFSLSLPYAHVLVAQGISSSVAFLTILPAFPPPLRRDILPLACNSPRHQ